MFNLVLVNPEIPHNAGAAGRLCLATGSTLHLIKPLGFSLDDKQVRRVGLDYWKDVDLRLWDSLEEFFRSTSPDRIWLRPREKQLTGISPSVRGITSSAAVKQEGSQNLSWRHFPTGLSGFPCMRGEYDPSTSPLPQPLCSTRASGRYPEPEGLIQSPSQRQSPRWLGCLGGPQ